FHDSRKYPRSSAKTFGSMMTASASRVGITSIASPPLGCDRGQKSAVARIREPGGEAGKLFRVDPSEPERDFLRTADLETLPRLKRLDEERRLQQRLVGARIEPRDATA